MTTFGDHLARHRELVRNKLAQVRTMLRAAGDDHDDSKYSDAEFSAFSAVFELGYPEYGTPGYYERLETLGPALEHHYASNPHHPEHHADGVAGMDLLEVLEMLADWSAAAAQNNRPLDLGHQVNRFGLGPQLERILSNTVRRLGW